MGCQCINDLVQISVHDLIQIVDRQADAVVGAAILREVVSPDLLAAQSRLELVNCFSF